MPRRPSLSPLAAAAAALLLATAALASPPASPLAPTERAKARAPELHLYLRAADGPARVPDGAAARPGDVVQVAYVALGHPFGVIVSIDGAAGVTLHHPAAPGGDTRLSCDGETPTAFAYALDGAPRFERFFLVGDTQPIAVDAVIDAAARLAARRDPSPTRLDLPPRLAQTTFLLEKRP